MSYIEIQSYVSENKYSLKCPYIMTPNGVTVHNTANDATARNEANYMKNNNSSTSFHDVIDDKEIVHCIPHNRNAFHAGDGENGNGNRKTIGVEICYSKSGGTRFDQAEQNASVYIATILKKNNWTTKNVYRHKDWSGKYCPHRTMDYGWERFLNMIQRELDKLNGNTTNGEWKQNSTGWWWQNNDGSYPINKWEQINGEWYYFNEKGYAIQNSWKQIGGTWYYFNNDCKMCTGWICLENKWYYLATNGAMQTGWVKDNEKYYYLNSDGVMQTGWQQINNTWYYLDTKGAMQVGWVQTNNNWYYMLENGAMVTGLQTINGETYYFADDGHMCRTNESGALK